MGRWLGEAWFALWLTIGHYSSKYQIWSYRRKILRNWEKAGKPSLEETARRIKNDS